MAGWNNWIGKKVYVTLSSGKVYSGIVKEVEELKTGLVFITLLDKYGKDVLFVSGEIKTMKEEE